MSVALSNQNTQLDISLKNGNYVRLGKTSYSHGVVINMYIVYKLTKGSSRTIFTTENGLFRNFTIVKDATDNSKYHYSGYGICFVSHDKVSIGNSVD